jgi:hypothetical protein
MSKIKTYGFVIAGSLIGLGAGFLYWKEIGCASGTCPITSNPVRSSLYGAVMGGLFLSLFIKNKPEDKNHKS